jgi:hypothetical protein
MDKITELLYNLTKEAGEIFISAGDKVIKFTVDTLTKEEYDSTHSIAVEKEDTVVDSNVTIVTGLWDLGRGHITDSFKRSYDHYKEKFAELLKTPSNMFIYVSKEDEEFVWKHRSRHNTHVRVMEIEEFQTWFEFYNQVQEIRSMPEWYGQAGWLTESPQATLKYYNPLVMSKMFLLNNASIFNPFNSDYFYWIDAGITNTVHGGYFYHDKVFNNLPTYTEAGNKFIFLTYPYEDGEEIHGFPRKEMHRECKNKHVTHVCRGGFFGGKKESIHQINSIYHGILSSTLSKKLMGTEESIFTILSYLYPEKVTLFNVGGNGLVWPFFEKLKDIERMIAEMPPPQLTYDRAKNNLYVLTFNSPQQFESVCNSIKDSDLEMFTKSRKILVNNSTDTSTFQKYDELCITYGFEEIHRENLGVCGGRQFIAEHFQESDADFYMFFEDDMHINGLDTVSQVCRNGFRKYVPNLYEKVVKIMLKEKFDFLKFSFSEFYGDNATQWAWYNVPQSIRTENWPDYDKLPEHGVDQNAPKTQFKNIDYVEEVPYITGDIYYSNWPQIVSREGNKKMFLDTVWARPYEQTWMSHMYQLTKKGELTSGILLASTIDHRRFEFYEGSLRKES